MRRSGGRYNKNSVASGLEVIQQVVQTCDGVLQRGFIAGLELRGDGFDQVDHVFFIFGGYTIKQRFRFFDRFS